MPADNIEPSPHFCCFQLDPLKDPRWAEFVDKHPRASVFHTVAWLRALRRTYGYEPVAFTTSPPTGKLTNGVVFCRVNSWLTGRRLVSLPFSDHCEPLCDSSEDLNFVIRYLQMALEHEGWKYLQIRPVNGNFSQTCEGVGYLPAATYFLHTLDLRPDLDEVFRRLDKSSVQRRIRRAERANLVEISGRSENLLKDFYGLFVITRGRHHLPPSPYSWFRNLIDCQETALEIRVAYKAETPIAAILTLQYKDVVHYKYGCSDVRYNMFGATPWLLWRAIAAAKSRGANVFDMGRTQQDNAGLLAFKNQWVSQPQRLVYWQYPYASFLDSGENWKFRIAKNAFSHMPGRLLTIIGELVYRHIG